MIRRPGHVFLADQVSIADRKWVASEKLVGHRQVTDAHLLAVALKNDAALVTLDHGLPGLVPAGFDQRQCVTVIS